VVKKVQVQLVLAAGFAIIHVMLVLQVCSTCQESMAASAKIAKESTGGQAECFMIGVSAGSS
jgi:hypothetical protein